MAAKKKLTLYFPEDMLLETKEEALRQDRSLSWIIQTAWRIARDEMKSYPGVNELINDSKQRQAS
ncbi:MAG: TIGR04563 family protein [Myxococcota bacterium]